MIIAYYRLCIITVCSLEKLAFISKPWIINSRLPQLRLKSILRDDWFFIECETNDPEAEVTLYRKYSGPNKLKVVKENDRVRKLGQNFMLKNANILDAAFYRCTAFNAKYDRIFLNLGRLIVSTSKYYVFLTTI